ncbi:MAG: M13 family metallopeptidase [Terriglobales bacterium]
MSRHLPAPTLWLVAATLTCISSGFAQPSSPPPRAGVDLAAMDRSANPCGDFYQYACGRWTATHPIPADQSDWARFTELYERNQLELRKLLDTAADGGAGRDALHQKVGDYYAACMNQAGVDALGTRPLTPEIARIAALGSLRELPAELGHLHHVGVGALFRFDAEQDFKDSNSVIAGVDQGGLGLPDRDYYLKTDAKSVALRSHYVAHVAKMLALLGDTPTQADAEAQTILALETRLAQASMERVKRREPANIYHKMPWADLVALTPNFDWNAYRTAIGAPVLASVNVAVPDFFKALNTDLAAVPLSDWKTYLRWHVVHSNANTLPEAFVNEEFAFYGTELRGAKQLRARWKRCVEYTDNDLGEALGQLYVADTFGPDGKASTLRMVRGLEAQLQQDIASLPWMTPATKKAAFIKLHAITNKIGYPDRWRDYSTLAIRPGDFFGDSVRANEFEFQRQLKKIGQPVDRQEWGMTPPTVNAYYNPAMNEIVFPAGILQPPFFDKTRDGAVNYGGIGAVIGHEMTHGFDDEGRQFDAQGNLRDWWTPEDGKAFQQRADCIADEYANFIAVADVKLNGKLTLGENTADNGGVRIAYMALLDSLTHHDPAIDPGSIDGFTPAQRFFIGYGQIWCENRTDAIARLAATVDPHSPGKDRVNGVLVNMPEFQQAFHCGPTDPMVGGTKACRVW